MGDVEKNVVDISSNPEKCCQVEIVLESELHTQESSVAVEDKNERPTLDSSRESDGTGGRLGALPKPRANRKGRHGKHRCRDTAQRKNINVNNKPLAVHKKTARKRPLPFGPVSKFFLTHKRPRKETSIPPTKFLLGGNISDPLNLNSLQDEDVNRRENAVTPASSPLPTPPRHKAKIEVIIPPNIRDPLSLLHTLDNAEYEKRLASLKTKTVRRRSRGKRSVSESVDEHNLVVKDAILTTECPAPNVLRDKCPEPSEIESVPASATVFAHKRCASESVDRPCPTKKECTVKKLRRLESQDKIVSPVVPQPGAWMRVHSHKPKHPPPRVDPKPPATTTPTFKNTNTRFQFGNYDRYYGYRNLNAVMDVRLRVFSQHRHLFSNKDVLDIGCNVGHISIAVARELGAKSVTGIDIDHKLIARARRNVKSFVSVPNEPKTETPLDQSDVTNLTTESVLPCQDCHGCINCHTKVKSGLDKASDGTSGPKNEKKMIRKPKKNRKAHNKNEANKFYFPASFPIMYGPIQVPGYPLESEPKGFPHNIQFKQANYVVEEALVSAEQAQFDVILCLSTSKWLHLNWGDAGLRAAFKRMHAQLRPGGKLVLEAQNWASYKKKKKLTKTIYENFNSIEFFPNKFSEYLLSPEVGFSKCSILGVPQHLCKGFRRPIRLYTKGDFTPSKAPWSDTHAPSAAARPVYAAPGPISHLAHSQWSANNSPLYGAVTPFSARLDNSAGESPFYNPRSDSYAPSYTSAVQVKNVYATLSSPQSEGSGSAASPFLEPSPARTPGRAYTPGHSHGHSDGATTVRKVYAGLHSPAGEPAYSPSVAGHSGGGGYSPLHTGTLPADYDNTNSNDRWPASPAPLYSPAAQCSPAPNYSPATPCSPAPNYSPATQYSPAPNYSPATQCSPTPNYSPSTQCSPAPNYSPATQCSPALNYSPATPCSPAPQCSPVQQCSPVDPNEDITYQAP